MHPLARLSPPAWLCTPAQKRALLLHSLKQRVHTLPLGFTPQSTGGLPQQSPSFDRSISGTCACRQHNTFKLLHCHSTVCGSTRTACCLHKATSACAIGTALSPPDARLLPCTRRMSSPNDKSGSRREQAQAGKCSPHLCRQSVCFTSAAAAARSDRLLSVRAS